MVTTIPHPTSDIRAALQDLELFAAADEIVLASLAEGSELIEFSEHEWMFREHDPAEFIYLVVSGNVSLVTCRPVVGCRQLTELGPGELLGWSPLAQRPRLSASAVATEPVTLLKINLKTITQLKEQNPAFFCEFLQRVIEIVAQRLSATRVQILDMCGVRLPEVQIESD